MPTPGSMVAELLNLRKSESSMRMLPWKLMKSMARAAP